MRMRLPILLAIIALGLALPARAGDYVESMDGWPTPACYVGSSGAPDIECNGSVLDPSADFSSQDGWVDSLADCRSGKCYRGRWDHDEESHHWRPLGTNGMTNGLGLSTTEIYIRFYVRLGSDHSAGIPSAYKITRITIPNHNLTVTLQGPNGASAKNSVRIAGTVVQGDLGGGTLCVVPIDWPGNVNRWVKIEEYYKLNTPGNADGECRLWVTDDVGNTSGAQNASLQYISPGETGFQSLAWIMANSTNGGVWPPGGGSLVRTVFVDDICIGDSLGDRTTTCADGLSQLGEAGTPHLARPIASGAPALAD